MLQNFEIRVISLKSQIDRREKIEKLFFSQKSQWSFIDAVIGKDLDSNHPLWHHYDEKSRLKILGYGMRNNEIACFLSHRAVWQECVKLNKPMLVLEDDIQLSPRFTNFDDVIPIMSKAISYLGNELFVRIGSLHPTQNFVKMCDVDAIHSLVRYRKDPLTTMGYLIAPDVAKNLLAHSEKFSIPVDNFLWRGWDHKCCLLDMHPPILFTSDLDTPSTIGDRVKPKIVFYKKILREWYRALQKKKEYFYQKRIARKNKRIV